MKENSDHIQVLDVFDISIGTIAMLIFPENQFPRIGMLLHKADNSIWKIAGKALPKPSELTNAYKDFDPPVDLQPCRVESQNPESKLEKGDLLYL